MSEDLVRIDQRANITPRDLAELRRRVRELSMALCQIQAMAAAEIASGVCSRLSVVHQVEQVAREATAE